MKFFANTGKKYDINEKTSFIKHPKMQCPLRLETNGFNRKRKISVTMEMFYYSN